jgi:hypothetical protein
MPKPLLTISSMAGATEGERWDPNKQLEKLRSGVISRLREQQKRSPTTDQATKKAGDTSQISIEDGTNPFG